MNETRVMMLLLDGAPFNAFFSLAKNGILPNLQKLMKKGCFNLLNSTIPPTSPVAIPSLLTGMNPGKHGRFGWGYIQNGIYKPTPPLQNLGGNTLWDAVGVANKKVILFNVPLTYPPIKVNGILISGPPTPRNKAYSYPPEIISTLKAKIGQYYVDMNIKGNDFQGDSEDAFIEKAYLVTRTRAQTMQYLMNNYDWTLFVGVFTTIDRLQHVFYGYFDEESPIFNIEKKKILIQYYQEIDQILGKIISSLDENTILFIVSDHGFEYLSTRVG
ncbi:MAG: alkaline phosphatase family protein, partial [Candidatus Ranarchaeia archaeon]